MSDRADELGQILLELEGKFTELIGAVRGGMQNGVFDVELITFPATGRVTIDTSTPFASVAVSNHTAAAVVIAVGGERESVPTAGVGVQLVGAQRGAVFALTGNVLTLYGPPAGQVSLQLFSIPQPPMFS